MRTYDESAKIARKLDAAGWPSAADDVRAGVPAATILERLGEIGEEASEAAKIVAELDA